MSAARIDADCVQLLQLLERVPDASQRVLAAQLAVSLGKLNQKLRLLEQAGLIRRDTSEASQHRLGVRCVLTALGRRRRATLIANLLREREAQLNALKLEIDGLRTALRTLGTLR